MKTSALKSKLFAMQNKKGPTQFSLTGASQYSTPARQNSTSGNGKPVRKAPKAKAVKIAAPKGSMSNRVRSAVNFSKGK